MGLLRNSYVKFHVFCILLFNNINNYFIIIVITKHEKKKNALMRNNIEYVQIFFIAIIYVDIDIHIINSPLLEKFSFIKLLIEEKFISVLYYTRMK